MNIYSATQASIMAENVLMTIAAFIGHEINELKDMFTSLVVTRGYLNDLHEFDAGLPLY